MDNYTKPLTGYMNNEDASSLGQVARETMSPKQSVGDSIDRGLILRRLLQEKGFYLVKKENT